MNIVLDPTTGAMIECRQLVKGPIREIWRKSLAKKLGRLVQGVGNIMAIGTNTIKFIYPIKIRRARKAPIAS